MQSIRTLYKVGKGPSSSHTMGPERAAKLFREMTPEADRYEVILYGSLAKTGVGHGTDRVLVDTLAPYPTKIVFASVDPGNMKHPNTLDLIAYQDNKETQRIRVESIGGGDIVVEGEAQHADAEVYPENSFAEIARFCQWRHVSLPEYVELNEGPEIWSFLEHIWHVMRQSIEDGLAAEGILPGGLNVQRKAKYLYERTHLLDLPQVRELQLVCSYAFAVAEQNAGNGTIVTAPTCGSCGVLPAVLMYMQQKYDLPDRKIAEALGVAGQGHQIFLPDAALVHRAEDARQMQRIVDVPQQAAHVHVCRRVPQSGQRCQERLYVLAAVRQQSVIEVSLPVTAADLRQTVRRKAEHRGAEHGDQRHILPGIVDDLQQGQRDSDLRGLVEIAAFLKGAGHIPLRQRLGEGGGPAPRRAHQDHNVLRCDRAQPFFGPHKGSTVQHFSDASGHKGCLLPVGILLGLQRIKFHSGVG